MESGRVFYMKYETFRRNTAAFKAPDDIYQICEQQGFQKISMPEYPSDIGKLQGKIWLITTYLKAWLNIKRIVPKGAIVFFQHPQSGKRLVLWFVKRYRKRGIKFIALIHDLESLRGGMQGIVSQNKKTNVIGDNEMLKQFDAVICHNHHMKEYLISRGFDPERLVDLEIFDYLSDTDRIQPEKLARPTICIAGNLAKVKAGYISKIFDDNQNSNLVVNLYGTRYEPEIERDNLIYHGAFAPEELAEHLVGDFGLVWDGTEASTCAGNTGEYLRYNNPHKASMYLSAGMPVIVWRQAAIAKFVLDNKVGIAVDDLFSLDKIISSMSQEDYRELAKNASCVSLRLRSGHYTIKAIKEAVERI